MDNSINPKWYIKTTVKKYASGGFDAPFAGMRNKRVSLLDKVREKQLAKAETDAGR